MYSQYSWDQWAKELWNTRISHNTYLKQKKKGKSVLKSATIYLCKINI